MIFIGIKLFFGFIVGAIILYFLFFGIGALYYIIYHFFNKKN